MSAALSAGMAFALMLLLTPGFINAFRRLSLGQTIYELGPSAHLKKQGTPNMGGLVMVTAVTIAWLGVSLGTGLAAEGAALMLFSFGCMAVGFADDFLKNLYRRHEGLRPRQKILGQLAAGVLFSVFCARTLGTQLVLPLSGALLDLGFAYVPLMTLMVVFLTNSANLQDGVDGILSTVTAAGALALGGMALFLAGRGGADAPGARAIAACCFALTGACLGFLKYNWYPARVFMGDTGSMYLGALMAGAAMVLRLQLWLPALCAAPIASSLSVILQRVYYKRTGGRRIFRMSPLHHHFELIGMKERRIVLMYGAATVFLCAAALLVFPWLPRG